MNKKLILCMAFATFQLGFANDLKLQQKKSEIKFVEVREIFPEENKEKRFDYPGTFPNPSNPFVNGTSDEENPNDTNSNINNRYGNRYGNNRYPYDDQENERNISGVIMVIDKLVAIGQKITPNIKDGKAVIKNSQMKAISVLPRSEAKDPVVHDMGGWSVPVSKHFKVVMYDSFQHVVVSFVYAISFQHSGSENGKGKYLTGVRASVKNIEIGWGYDLDVTSELISISNVGTQEKVIAGATIEMSYAAKSWLKTVANSIAFHITGDGKLYKLD